MVTSSLLIIVSFLAGNVWGPQVSTQTLPNAETCTAAMNAVAEAIYGASKSNINSVVQIEKDNASGLKIIAGVNQRIMATITCKEV